MENILIIGNGFDLYHGLPTRYTDFLRFVELWDHFKVKYNSNSSNPKDGSDGFVIRLGEKGTITQESMKDFADYKLYFEREKIEYLDHYIHRNAWIKFFNSTNYKKEGWIDFEREMEKVLVVIDKLTSHTKDYYKDDTAYSHMLIEKLPYIECFAERLEERGLFLEQIISYEEELKEYIFLKVKTVFDTSTISSSVLSAYQERIKELEWELNDVAELGY